MAVKIYDVQGGYTALQGVLNKLGFVGRALKPLAPVVDKIFDGYSSLQDRKFKKAEAQVSRWSTKLSKLLSKDVGSHKNKRRPGQNKYPMLNSSSMKDSVKVDLQRSVRDLKWVYEFTGSVTGGVGGQHASLTNDAANSGSRHVQWRGWFDETFDKGHSASLVGAQVLMSKIFRGGVQ